MNLDLIRTFITVIQLGSFQSAAEKLYLPQPTISHRIQKLEADLGKKLIVRRRGENQLTVEGKVFFPFALKLLQTMKQGQAAIDEVNKGETGRLIIGCTNSYSAYILPEIIQLFMQKYPHIDITVDSYSTEEIIHRVKMRKFQVGFTRYATNESSLTFELLNNEQIYLIVSRKHPLAGSKSVTLKEIVNEPLILYQQGTQLRDTLDFVLDRSNISYHVKYEMNNIELIKQLVHSLLGVTLFTPSYMRRELVSGEFVKIPIEDNPFPTRQVYLIYNKEDLNSLDNLFIDHVLSSSN
jgi:DNA-binding transcriptional LysR family regulator